MSENDIKKIFDIDPTNIRKILIRVNNWIGDIVMISPAMKSIRNHFKKAKISILAKTWVVESLKGNPYYDELIEYENLTKHKGLIGRWRVIQNLRERQFDIAILFQKAFEAAFFSYLSGIPLRVGYDTDKRGFLLTHKINETSEARRKHHVEYFLDIARSLGCAIKDKSLYFHIGPDDQRHISEIIDSLGLRDEKPVVAIHPGTSKPERGWHAEKFSLLADRIYEKYDAHIVIIGGRRDEVISKKIAHSMKNKACDLSGKLSIQEFGAFLEKCSLFVGNDSGPMHIAAAVGIPIVAIFGPGTPEKTGPFMDPSRYIAITKSYQCAPCRQHFFRDCQASPSGKPYCIEDITVEEVFCAASDMISLQ